MTRLRDPKTGRFVKATQIVDSISVMEPVVPEVEQNTEIARSDIMTGEPIVLGQEQVQDEQTQEQVQEVSNQKPKNKNPRFSSENSRAGVIETALVSGGTDIDDIVDKVIAERSEDDPKKVKSQISAILRDIKKGKGRWKKYSIVQDENVLKIVVD